MRYAYDNMDDLQTSINELRMLVFVEKEPQSNIYQQVAFNREKFKEVSDAVFGMGKKSDDLRTDFEESNLEVSTEEYTLPDLQSIIT